MPKFKHQRRAEAAAEETARDEGTTGDEPTSTAPDQAISGAGPDAPAPTIRDGYTAPWGTVGFTMSQHAKCMNRIEYELYYTDGPTALPKECLVGHLVR